MKAHILLLSLVILNTISCLPAQHLILSEMTPSATGLNGLTLLSESASDNIGNPVTTASGTTAVYLNPFSLDKLNVYGLHTTQWVHLVKMGAGTTYLYASDYRKTDYYVNLAIDVGDLIMGYTRHFLFWRMGEEDGFETGDDFGVRYDYQTGLAEVIYRLADNEDEWLMNSLLRINPEFNLAGGILWDSNRDYCFRIGSCATIGGIMSFLASWQSKPSRLGFGVKFNLEAKDFTYAVRQHNELKLTHAVEFGYRW